MNHLIDSFRFLAGAARGLPQQVSFYITGRCNARCKTCFYWENLNRHRAELTTDEFRQIAGKIWPFQILYLTGGEPFLRPDLPEICEAFADKARTIHLFSNSLLPGRLEKHTRRIIAACPTTRIKVSLSLDGLGHVHDEIRGVAGNYERFLEGHTRLRKLKKRYPDNLWLNVISTVARHNARHIPETIEHVRRHLKVDSHGLNLARGDSLDPEATQVPVEDYRAAVGALRLPHGKNGAGHSVSDRLRSAITREMHNVIIQTVTEQREVIPCVAGRQVLVIDEVGDVSPCELIRREMGNVRQADYDLRTIFRSGKADTARRDVRDTKCHCTHECFVQANIVHSPSRYPSLIRRMFRKPGARHGGNGGQAHVAAAVGKSSPADVVTILGIRIRNVTQAEVLARVQSFIGDGPRSVFIVNARTANLGYADASYRACLNRADLVLNDGTGIRWAAHRRGARLKHNCVGTDLVPWLLENLVPPNARLRVFLLGGHASTVSGAASAIERHFPGVHVVGWHDGFFSRQDEPSIAVKIRRARCDLCLIGMGNPKQELWIERNRERVGGPVMIGVGGLFDYLSGQMQRAPQIFRRHGSEWVYIVMRQPFKWRRYILDNPLFLLRTMRGTD